MPQIKSDFKKPEPEARKQKTANVPQLFLALFAGVLLGIVGTQYYPAAKMHLSSPDVVNEMPKNPESKPEFVFSFYDILTQEDEENQVTHPKSSEGSYVIQAGSFRKASDADQLKAQLALMGFEPFIQTVNISEPNKTFTVHRVRIGPYREADLQANVSRLNQQKIKTMTFKASN